MRTDYKARVGVLAYEEHFWM